MKKNLSIKIIFLTAILATILSGCSTDKKSSETPSSVAAKQAESTDKAAASEETQKASDSKSLVIYFDYSENIDTSQLDADAIASASLRTDATEYNTGKLKMLVDEIRTAKNADVFSIQVNEAYAPKYDDMVSQARQDIADNKDFTFKSNLTNLSDYETVYFVTPVWWSELPQPVQVFFQQYDFSGKTIIPVVVHRGSGFGRTVSQMQEYEPDATFVDGKTIEADINNENAKQQFNEFLNSYK